MRVLKGFMKPYAKLYAALLPQNESTRPLCRGHDINVTNVRETKARVQFWMKIRGHVPQVLCFAQPRAPRQGGPERP